MISKRTRKYWLKLILLAKFVFGSRVGEIFNPPERENRFCTIEKVADPSTVLGT